MCRKAVIEHMLQAGSYTPEDFRRVESGTGTMGSNSHGGSGALAADSTPPSSSAMETEVGAADEEDTWREADFLPPGMD
jgi:hypothetical protein